MRKNNTTFALAALVCTVIFTNACRGTFFSDCGNFISAFLRDPKSVGSVIPSSRFLTKAMTKYIDKKRYYPVSILEIGAGTGAITEKIIEKMNPEDRLDVIEIDSKLSNVLKQKFEKYANVHVHCVSILDWNPAYQYDYIVSALPFNSFDAQTVEVVLHKFKSMIKDKGIISYVELMAMSSVKKSFLRGGKKRDFANNVAHRSDFCKKYEFDKDRVMLNIPPARVYHLKITK